MTVITEIVTLPTNWVSLCITPDATTDAYQVLVTHSGSGVQVSNDMFTMDTADIDSIRGLHYLPRCFHMPRGELYNVQVTAYNDGVAGTTSDPVQVDSMPATSRPRAIRQALYDYLKDNIETRIAADRFGRPRSLEKFLGAPGAVVSIGVAYASNDQIVDSTSAEQTVTVPFVVMGKGLDPDDAEDLVDIAETVRAILDGRDLGSFGCDEKRWTCQAPETMGDQKRTELRMQLEVSGWRDRGTTITNVTMQDNDHISLTPIDNPV